MVWTLEHHEDRPDYFENVPVNITYLFIPKRKKQRKEEEEVSSLSIKLQMLS